VTSSKGTVSWEGSQRTVSLLPEKLSSIEYYKYCECFFIVLQYLKNLRIRQIEVFSRRLSLVYQTWSCQTLVDTWYLGIICLLKYGTCIWRPNL